MDDQTSGLGDLEKQLRSEIGLVQTEAGNEKDALKDLISNLDSKIINESAIFKEMLDKESEERQLESDSIRAEAQNLKHDLEHQAASLQNELTSVKGDLQDTKDQGLEELKKLIEEEKEERQKEAEIIHDNLTCKVRNCFQ